MNVRTTRSSYGRERGCARRRTSPSASSHPRVHRLISRRTASYSGCTETRQTSTSSNLARRERTFTRHVGALARVSVEQCHGRRANVTVTEDEGRLDRGEPRSRALDRRRAARAIRARDGRRSPPLSRTTPTSDAPNAFREWHSFAWRRVCCASNATIPCGRRARIGFRWRVSSRRCSSVTRRCSTTNRRALDALLHAADAGSSSSRASFVAGESEERVGRALTGACASLCEACPPLEALRVSALEPLARAAVRGRVAQRRPQGGESHWGNPPPAIEDDEAPTRALLGVLQASICCFPAGLSDPAVMDFASSVGIWTRRSLAKSNRSRAS